MGGVLRNIKMSIQLCNRNGGVSGRGACTYTISVIVVLESGPVAIVEVSVETIMLEV